MPGVTAADFRSFIFLRTAASCSSNAMTIPANNAAKRKMYAPTWLMVLTSGQAITAPIMPPPPPDSSWCVVNICDVGTDTFNRARSDRTIMQVPTISRPVLISGLPLIAKKAAPRNINGTANLPRPNAHFRPVLMPRPTTPTAEGANTQRKVKMKSAMNREP